MGMFDKPTYLTGKGGEGYVEPGETFWLHNCRIDGTGAQGRPQAKLQVSRERDGERSIVWTSGAGIVLQIQRMDNADKARFPIEVRLDQIAPKQAGNNPTNVLTPADEPAPDTGGFESAVTDAGF